MAVDGPAYDTTSRREAARVDGVKVEIAWSPCYDGADTECADIEVPRDYDRPNGPTARVAISRSPATRPALRKGTLYVNPGGPGSSAVDYLTFARYSLPPGLVRRFDIVGVDPRGVGSSEQLRCFATNRARTEALRGMAPYFPRTNRAATRTLRATGRWARACSRVPLTRHVGTADNARDLEVVRQAIGDGRMNFLGFSYGSQLGQVYAGMFPDRIRAMTIDGVNDPRAWRGTDRTARTPMTVRLRSAQASERALRYLLRNCALAGQGRCALAGGVGPQRKLHRVLSALRREPLQLRGQRVVYQEFVSQLRSGLYFQQPDYFIDMLVEFYDAVRRPTAAALEKADESWDRLRSAADTADYNNIDDVLTGVICGETRNPYRRARWRELMRVVDHQAPLFGRIVLFRSAPCTRQDWTVRAADRYTGPWSRRPRQGLLVIGNLWDPTTRYEGAVTAAQLSPGARLLTSTNIGHLAMGSGACVDRAVSTYFIERRLPPSGKVCRPDSPPFEAPGSRR